MKNIVISTPAYDKEVLNHSVPKALNNFRKKVSIDGYILPRDMVFTTIPGNYVKLRHQNYRTILTTRIIKIEGDEVRIFAALKLFSRGAAEYETFKMRSTSEAARDKITGKSSFSWKQIEIQVKELLKKPVVTDDNLEFTLDETKFISSPLGINHNLFDTTIFETKEWVDNVSEVDFTDFSNAATQIEKFIFEHISSAEGWYPIEFKEKSILAFKKEENWILAKLVDKQLNGDYSTEYPSQVPVDFRRGYPFSFLDDQDEWRLMELDSKSNMVLSSQQVDIVSNEIVYPLFLTGRAGSGKSTLLQYLFSEVILRYLKNRNKGQELKVPVYLSYSTNLIDDAKKLCKTLLEKNNVYKKEMQELGIQYKTDILPLLSQMFFVFRDLLCECIEKKEPDTLRQVFPKEKYVSFPQFNKMWEEKFGKIRNAAKDYGPSISWHVIRTYIKGWDGDAYLTPDDYENIGEKNRSVTSATFKEIYEKVWKKWYSQLDGFWDDQDLAIYCLQNDCTEERFSAVFCDESQDFTRVELDFILGSSSFAHRSLHRIEDFNKLPFVFAGDEFQTLNPTGFSWESLRGYFTARLCALVGLVPQKGMTPDPIVLSENFRSTRNVVKLANRIQLLRASRFGEFSQPQKSHFSEDGNCVYCILPADMLSLNKLKEKGVVLIVPAKDGESVEKYIVDSPLKDLISFEDGVPEGLTILNPTQAKGLEYPNVAVYGFTNDGNSGFQIDELLKWFSDPKEDFVKDIELKYQISNAYVAVTRATSNLYIIDDVDRNSFWAFALNQSEDTVLEVDVNELQEKMLERLSFGKREQWPEEELGYIEYVGDIDITDENLKFYRSPEHKNDLENRAQSLYDAKLMRQAAILHKSAGNKVDEARCRAKAFLIEGKYMEAIMKFIDAKMYNEAVNVCWLELNENPDTHLIDIIADFKGKTRNKIVDFCLACKARSIRDAKIALGDMLSLLQTHQTVQQYIKAFEYIVIQIIKNLKLQEKDDAMDLISINESCATLKNQYDISVDVSNLGMMAFKMGAYKEALRIWEGISRFEKGPEFYKAKLKTEKYPDNIVFFEGTKDPDWNTSLLTIYRDNLHISLSESQRLVVCKAIRMTKDSKEEYEHHLPFMLRNMDSIEKTNSILEEAVGMGIQLNKDVLSTIAELRYSDLQSWRRPSSDYVDSEVKSFFDAIEAIRRMRQNDFQDFLQRSLSTMKVYEFCGNNYKIFSRKKTSRLVFTELGKAFEQSGKFALACIFYEWAVKNIDEPDARYYFDERWIASKERQADSAKENSSELKSMANEKRRVLGIGDKVLSVEPTMPGEAWERIYSQYLQVSSEIRTSVGVKPARESLNEQNIPASQDASSKSSVSRLTDNPVTSSKQTLQYGKYSFVYFPQKKDVVIKDTVDEYSVRIRNGVFPENSDFILKDDRLFCTYDNSESATPFYLSVHDGILTVKIYDHDVDTGMTFAFKVDS